jgi:hypothetical protein
VDLLGLVSVSKGLARLAAWGTLDLTDPRAAVLRLAWSEDLELPESVAADMTSGVLLLNDELGRLLFLPYAGECVATFDLREGEPLHPLTEIPRDPDRGMRMAVVRLVPALGALHLTETTLMFFHEDCTLAWRQDDDFGGWAVEAIRLDEVDLVLEDWSGNERHQTWQLSTGKRLS